MKRNNIIFLLVLLMINVSWIGAQTDTTKTQIEKMTIIGTKEPIIEIMKKPEINPDINNETINFPIPEYQTKTVPYVGTVNEQKKVEFQQLPKFKIEDKLLRNYLILGFANYVTPLVEFYANMQAHRSHAFGLHLKHLSSQGGIKNLAHNAYSHNNIDAFYKYMANNFILKADVFFNRDVVHYYGFNPEIFEQANMPLPSNDSIKQRYALAGGKLGLSNNTSQPTDFQYFLNFGFSNFSDRKKNNENNFTTDFQFNKGFEWFNFSNYQTLGVLLKFDYYTEHVYYPTHFVVDSLNKIIWKNLELRSKSWLFDLHPTIGAEWDEYYVRLGVDLAITKTDSATVFHIHPDIEGKIKVIPEKLDVFVGLGGEVTRNSMQLMVEENPFIAPSMAFVSGSESFMNKKVKIYGGLNANILEGLDLKAGVHYSYVDNMPFYIINEKTNMIPTYTPFYANVNEINVFLKTNYAFSDKIRANMSIDFYSYTSKKLEHAYYKPNFQLNVSGEYRPIQKLKLDLGFKFYSKMWACYSDYALKQLNDPTMDKNIQLPSLYNLSFGGEYNAWKELYLFLSLNNILNQNYERYLFYPSQGITVMGGIRFRF